MDNHLQDIAHTLAPAARCSLCLSLKTSKGWSCI